MFLQRFFAAFLSGPRFGANIRYELGMWSSLKIEGNDRKIMVQIFENQIFECLDCKVSKIHSYVCFIVVDSFLVVSGPKKRKFLGFPPKNASLVPDNYY